MRIQHCTFGERHTGSVKTQDLFTSARFLHHLAAHFHRHRRRTDTSSSPIASPPPATSPPCSHHAVQEVGTCSDLLISNSSHWKGSFLKIHHVLCNVYTRWVQILSGNGVIMGNANRFKCPKNFKYTHHHPKVSTSPNPWQVMAVLQYYLHPLRQCSVPGMTQFLEWKNIVTCINYIKARFLRSFILKWWFP